MQTEGLTKTPYISSEDYYRAVREVADLVFAEFASPEGGSTRVGAEIPFLVDNRDADIDPHLHQTRIGLFVEINREIPESIWTPWGTWECFGGGTPWRKERMDEFLRRLGTERHARSGRWAHLPPSHLQPIRQIGDLTLPPPETLYYHEFGCEVGWTEVGLAKALWKLEKEFYEKNLT